MGFFVLKHPSFSNRVVDRQKTHRLYIVLVKQTQLQKEDFLRRHVAQMKDARHISSIHWR